MPKIPVVNMAGKSVGEIELSEAVFGIKPNRHAVHASIVNFLANQRQGTQSTKTRAEVSGGGKKPWRQKGTGRARQGSTRAPHWRHGGIAFGPKPRDYRYTLNRKLRRLALKSVFSAKVLEDEMIVVDAIKFDEIKTKSFVEMLQNLGATKKALVLVGERDEKIIKSARNIPGVKTALVNTINVYDLVHHDHFIVAKDAVAQLEEVYA